MNPHGLLHTHLKRTCLPFHHFGIQLLYYNLYNYFNLRGGCCVKHNPLAKRYSIVLLRQSTTSAYNYYIIIYTIISTSVADVVSSTTLSCPLPNFIISQAQFEILPSPLFAYAFRREESFCFAAAEYHFGIPLLYYKLFFSEIEI